MSDFLSPAILDVIKENDMEKKILIVNSTPENLIDTMDYIVERLLECKWYEFKEKRYLMNELVDLYVKRVVLKKEIGK